MASFYGEYDYALDSKNRLSVPARFREALKAEKKNFFMVAKGFDNTLYLFLPSQWEALEANRELFSSPNKEEVRAFKRFFYGSAAETPVDGLGRILIPHAHMEHAGLGKNVVIRGVGNKAEIWDADKWAGYEKAVIAPALPRLNKIFDI